MSNALQTSIREALETLRKGKIYGRDVSVEYRPERETVYFVPRSDAGQPYSDDWLSALFENENVQKAQFLELGRSSAKGRYVAPFGRMLRHRALMEFAKITPAPQGKNYLYRAMGVDVPSPSEVVVAPMVAIDYIYPRLLRIEPGAVVGEGAKIWTHRLHSDRFVIGNVIIGEDTTVGSDSILWPGAIVGNGVEVGSKAVVSKPVPDMMRIPPNYAFVHQATLEPVVVRRQTHEVSSRSSHMK